MKTLVIALVLFLAGCSTLDQYTEQGIDAVKTLHDKQLETGELLICGTSLRAFLARYAGDQSKFEAALELCGYARYFTIDGVAK